MMTIGIIDIGIGNVGSVANMLEYLDYSCRMVKDPENLKSVDKIILPGVGMFDYAMRELNTSRFTSALNEEKESGKHILGICLGAQLMCANSEEGKLDGLGWFDANVLKFNHPNLKVPHMGWTEVDVINEKAIELTESNRFYFVHSYYIKSNHPKDVWMSSKYGHTFESSLSKENLFACQFHPEKSHSYGMNLLKGFCEL